MTTVPDRGWDRLDAETKEVVVAVIAEAESTGEYASVDFGELDIHARPYGDEVAWGVVNGADSFCVARGVWPRARSPEIVVEPRQEVSGPALDSRELATVLAALRYWQREGLMSAGVEHDIASDGDHVAPLAAAEIDTLCQRLNVSQAGLTQTAVSDAQPEQAEATIQNDGKPEVALAAALAVWKEQRQHASTSEITPLRADVGADPAAERRNATLTWADQLDTARESARDARSRARRHRNALLPAAGPAAAGAGSRTRGCSTMRASGKRGEGAMTIDLGDRGWDRLNGEAIGAVEAVIAVAASTSDYVRREFRQTDICAYPDDDTIVWSVSVGPGNVIAEGVRLRASSAHIASAEQLQAETGLALNGRELATVLAALRFWRREQLLSTGGEHAVAAAGGRFPQLTVGEVDALWERLNVAQTALFQTPATSDTTPGRARKTDSAEHQLEEPSEAAMAAWEELERHAFACTTIPLWPDVDLDDPAECQSSSTQWALRHNANVSWANQLGMARDEAEFHQIFSSLQSDPAVDTVAARHIAYALTGDPHLQHVSREAAIGAMESYFYQQREQAHQEQRRSQGGAAR